jgi:hypothetical protein
MGQKPQYSDLRDENKGFVYLSWLLRLAEIWSGKCKYRNDWVRRDQQEFQNLKELGETKRDAETKGFFIDRIADRRRNHPDHRGDRDSELAARPHGGQ